MLDDRILRDLVLALAPLAEIDSVAGLRGRSRDPREHPATGGEQRDAAAALDAAHDKGTLGAHRTAFRRFLLLPPDVQVTASWVAERGGAVREGALVGAREWSETYGRLEGPTLLRERLEKQEERERALSVYLAALKRLAGRVGLSEELARKIDDTASLQTQARCEAQVVRDTLAAWGRDRLEGLAGWWMEVA